MLGRILSYCTLPLLLLLSSGNFASRADQNAPEGFNPGPDIITGEIGLFGGLEQFGTNGSQVGLAPSTTSCNAGDQFVNFFALPATNHPVIPHNLYRMSGGPGNDERFEQIGQGWPKHAFGADQASDCFTCQPGGNFTHLGVGCSDTYASFQNAEQTDLGSRALINPFTGEFQTTANNHNGHVHDGTSHRILVQGSDLNTTLNQGATYYAEVQYISSDEYAWCQTHPGECNMYNNVSYRRYNVSGTTNFVFTEAGNTVRMAAAVTAWPGATINPIEPAPGIDGRAYIAYKVTNPSAGVWHYEYALYNENLDRGIQSFSIPLGCAITLSNLGFHAPLNHPGFPNDGTAGGLGFSNAPWTSNQTTDAISWSSETIILNTNANAIRWGTMYNFRFDSDKPPVATNATIGFFKTGTPVTVAIMGPNACDQLPSPTPTVTPGVTPGATPSPTATPSATVTPVASATPSATVSPTAPPQALNLSTRLRVQTGDNVGIAGLIITGTAPKQLLFRGIGPSLAASGVPDALANPTLDLRRPDGTRIRANNDWQEDPAQAAAIQATGLAPQNNLEAAIFETLNPGSYTVILRGMGMTTGIGLVEVYDVSQGVDSKLANLSTRALVTTGDSIVIAGFTLGGSNNSNRIVARGIGPSLTAFGVSNALGDPALTLRDNNGAIIASNDNWQDNPAQATELMAAGLAPTNNLESGIAITLPPGAYTALLSGLNNTTGVGVVEIYDRGPASGTPPPTPTPPASPSPSSSPGITPSPTPSATATPPAATPTPSPAGACTENFDGTPTVFLPNAAWVISTVDPFSPPNCLFAPDPPTISDATIDSVNISINSPSAVLSFRNNFNTEYDPPPAEVFWDGYVMEVSVNGGAFNDVTDPAVGGTFVSGPYTGEIDGSANNPLAGRFAWSGNSGGYIQTVINLPASLNGQTIKVRFRMGTDESVGAPGVRVDDFSLVGGSCP